MQNMEEDPTKPFQSAKEDAVESEEFSNLLSAQRASPSYQLAFIDRDFMLREELRPVRLQLELLKPDIIQRDQNVESTIAIFGGSRILDRERATKNLREVEALAKEKPNDPTLARQVRIAKSLVEKSRFYDEAVKFTDLVTKHWQKDQRRAFVPVTGGGPGIMEAANRGAFEAGAKSIGFSMVLPNEQIPNFYVSPELCFQFHYFAIRKMQFLIRARAMVAFPGGYGTFDELFEALTLMATHKIQPIPLLLFGREYWEKVVNWEALVDEGVVAFDDLHYIRFVETAEEAFRIIKDFYPDS